MGGKRYTIKDVAKVAGTSTGTVSRYISNKGYVSQEARDKIEMAIEQLQYIPNTAARNMVNRKSKLVGVAVPEINNPFLADLMVRIESSLCKRGYSVMLCNTGFDAEKTSTFINDLIMRDAEGIILAASDISCTDSTLARKINHFMAGVSVGQKIPDFDCINFPDMQIATDMTEYLVSMGHKEIACIAFNDVSTQTIIRKEGVIQTLKRHGLPVRPSFFVGFEEGFHYVPGENGGYLCARKLLEQRPWPTAIVAINDHYAIGAYKAATEKGLCVGEDISIVGFDNIDLARFISPALTTVNCDTYAMAELAADLLHQKICGNYGMESREIILPAQIVYRNSVKTLDGN
ncbi:MAG: LacI family DNA-binding transcriptional regulator [Ruthenibacterium sp.]